MNTGLALAAGAALLFGGYLFVVKRYFGGYPAPVFVVVTNACALLWYVPVAAATVDEPVVPAGATATTAGVVAGTVVLTAVALVAFFRALLLGEVSVVAPVSKIVPAFVLPIEVLALDECLGPLQVAGVVVATAAVYLANYRPGELVAPLRRALTDRAPRLALVSAATFGVVDVGKRLSMQEYGVAPEAFVVASFAGVGLLLAPFARRVWPAAGVRADLPKFLGIGLVAAVGQHAVAVAFQTLSASVASPIVNAQAVVAVVLGGLLLGEEHFRVRLVAAGLAIAGVTLIALG